LKQRSVLAVVKHVVIPGCLTILLAASYVGASPSEVNVALRWNCAALQGIRDVKLGAPVVARALAIVHTYMYDVRQPTMSPPSGLSLAARYDLD
jgi:hypothetical protein